MIYLMIVAMGLVVFFNRYLFIEPRLPVRLNYFPGGPSAQPEPDQPLPAGRYLRRGVDVLDTQRIDHRVIEHGAVLSAALVALIPGQKKARGVAGRRETSKK